MRKILFLILAILFFWVSETAVACPACKEAVAKIGTMWTALGFNWSILFMLAVPGILVTSFAGALFIIQRKNSKRV